MHHYILRCEPFGGGGVKNLDIVMAAFCGGGGGVGGGEGVKNLDIFMAAICDMALGRLAYRKYFFGIVHDWINTGFMRKKEASSYIQMVFIVCCLLLTAPNKRKTISVSHVTDGVFWVCITILWLVHNRN